MPSILFICTANQCRSPMAMALMRKRLEDLSPGDERRVESAGTWGFESIPATANAIAAIRERGLDLEDHRSRKVTEEILRQCDLILTMERYQHEALTVEFPEMADRVYMLTEMAGERWDIKDPIGGSLEEYRDSSQAIDSILDDGMERILELASANSEARKKE